MVPILILDGGLGTTLEQMHRVHFNSNQTPLWSSHLLISDPGTLASTQRSFATVPVDILETATYQISVEGFAATKNDQFPRGVVEAEIPPFLEKSVQILEGIKTHDTKVALSLGPYGACLIPSQEYSGEYGYINEQGLQDWHRRRFRVCADIKQVGQRVCYIALETVPRVDEIRALRRALGQTEELKSIPFWISCVFPNEDEKLPDGTSVEESLRGMLDPDHGPIPWGIGINCTKLHKLEHLVLLYEQAVKELLAEGTVTSWPALLLYPDGTNGEVYNTTTQKWEVPEGLDRETKETWEAQLASVVKGTEYRGKWTTIVVGGCCMAGPESISRLRKTLRPI